MRNPSPRVLAMIEPIHSDSEVADWLAELPLSELRAMLPEAKLFRDKAIRAGTKQAAPQAAYVAAIELQISKLETAWPPPN